MDVFISVDMEGVAGVAHVEQVRRGSGDFEVARRLMTGEANAAIDGAFAAGADRVLVNDAHADMYNLLPEELDPRAEALLGSPKIPHSMVQGITDAFDLAIFVGYHAPPGTFNAVLDHTFSGLNFHRVLLNGVEVSEAEMNAAVIGGYGVPLALVTGDTATCAMVSERLPGVATVAVKQSFGRQSAAGLHPSRACDAIRAAAADVVSRAVEFAPVVLEGPVVIEVETRNTLVAEACALAPGVERPTPRIVRYTAPGIAEAFRCLVAWLYLGAAVS